MKLNFVREYYGNKLLKFLPESQLKYLLGLLSFRK